jgi:hypothetical protein
MASLINCGLANWAVIVTFKSTRRYVFLESPKLSNHRRIPGANALGIAFSSYPDKRCAGRSNARVFTGTCRRTSSRHLVVGLPQGIWAAHVVQAVTLTHNMWCV